MAFALDSEHLLQIIESANAIIWEAKLPELRFTFVSQNAERLLGFPIEQWLEPDFWMNLIHPDDRKAAVEFCISETAMGADHEFDYRICRKDGSFIWLRDIVTLVTREDGVVTHLRGVMIDITEAKTLEAELKIAKERAEAADAAKARFLAHMGHELRTPLNGILGMTQVLSMRSVPAPLRQLIDVIDESGKALLRLVENVLHVSGAAAEGAAPRKSDWFDLGEILNTVRLMLQTQAEQKWLPLDAVLSDAARGRFFGDAVGVQQILTNLGSNALRYTESGSVAMTGDWVDGRLILTVADTGAGMTAAFLEQAFEPFSRSQESYEACAEGLGLGLSIVKQIVEGMDGSISVESAVGQGSTFVIDLPMERETAAAGVAANQAMRALCVDDNAVNAVVLAEMLRALGFVCDIAANGREAVEAATACRYDLILMDLRMPVLNGVDASQQIRHGEVARGLPAAPIIGVTAQYSAHAVADCFAAGMNIVLSKPVQLADLVEQVELLLKAPRAA